MNKPASTRMMCVAVVLCFGLWHGLVRCETVYGAPDETLAVGRDNPFEDIPRIKKPVIPALFTPAEPSEEAPELFVEMVTLRFLDAENLKKAIDRMSSSYGAIAINQRNNSVIICDTQERVARIVGEIKKADRTPQQIMIEVVIVDVQLGDDAEIGINWDILSDKNYDIGYRQNFTASRLRSTIENEDTTGDATAFVTRGLGGDFSVISGTIRNVVHLIQQKREAEILASPRVMVLSGQTASIESVEELPYTEVMDTAAGGAGALTSTQFKLVGVQMHVSANLTDGNDIFLTVDAVQNVATGQSNTQIPIVDTRKAKTSLLLRDGQVVVLAGLRRQEKTREVDQIPFLGDLPIVGGLFKSTNTVVKNSELVIFLSPHIYKGEPVPEAEMTKFKEITERPPLSLESDRDRTRQMLLKKIERLQNQENQDVGDELLVTLSSLEEIISEELQEALASSESALAAGEIN
ncbi:MAG TPA: secretin N-terminal domain-containing protein [Sedimentisphaerales bacterium]|nr:secretin N-terminal domain-containing protein [Sedimentisphaerales bacterium]